MWRRLIDLDHANHATLPRILMSGHRWRRPARWLGDGRALALRSPWGAAALWRQINCDGHRNHWVIRRRFFAPQNPKRPPIWGVDLKEVDGLGAPAEAVLG